MEYIHIAQNVYPLHGDWGVQNRQNIRNQKNNVQETVAAAFTDHHAVILRTAISARLILRGRGYWRMNIDFMSDKNFQTIIQKQWAKWKTHKKYYPHSVMWWARYVKRIIQLFINERTERCRDRLAMENSTMMQYITYCKKRIFRNRHPEN